jgi:tetratricopeptide (TPR) repeat protein
MKTILWTNRRHSLCLRALLIVPSLSFSVAPEAWARSCPLRTPVLRLVAGAQTEGTQTPNTRSPTLGGQIEDALVKGNLDTVRMLVPKFLTEPNMSADMLLRIGVNLAQHELFLEAASVFGRCVEDHPGLFEGYYNLALAKLALRQYPVALATIQKAPRASRPQEVARTYLRGKIELALGQNAQAEQDLAAVFAAAPQEENYALDLGLAYLRARKYQPAVEVFEKAGSFQKDSPFILLGLSLAQFLRGQNAESIATCHAVLSLHPDFSPVRVLLAFVLTMQGNVDEAAQVAAQGLHDPAPFPYLYYIHAAALLKQQSKDYDVILKDLASAERSISACSLCYLAQSKAHQKMGERDAATADLEKALEVDSTFAEAWYRLASLYDQAGRHVEAQQARRRFEDIKENKANRETEMLRRVFLKTLGGEGSP